jgi:hypothetical protein
MAGEKYDRANQDAGNILALEHVNVRVPDQQVATLFYVMGLGMTRDPYLMVGLENMWINMGQEQFHLPTAAPQVLRGHIGIVTPCLDALAARLAEVRKRLSGTKFRYAVESDHVAVTCPWGNQIRCYAPSPELGTTLGIPYVEFPVAPGDAKGIARFYERVMLAPATTTSEHGHDVTQVKIGGRQCLLFRETSAEIPAYDGHHIAVYISNFSGPHDMLKSHGLITEESNPYQYRFKDIVDPDTGRPLFTIEHEVRSFTHPMYLRPMVNRNPAQRQAAYQAGRDAFVPGMV